MSLSAPLRLRSIAAAEEARKVTWLELFFDLIFVAAVAQVAAPLHAQYSVVGLVRFAPLFVLIWWAWTGHTVFSTRFDSDDAVQRGLTLLQMFAVAAMAANAKDALDSRSSAGFAAAYAVMRFVLVAQYFRARHVPDARPLTVRYLFGHGTAAVLWLSSAFVPAPDRFWIWAVAFAVDLGTPWLAVPHSVKVPPDAAHLPERFGLFTLILLGESVVAVMQGMESQEDWTPAAATSAFLGMGICFLLWWWYFDGAAGAAEQPVRTRRDAVRFHIWSYAHFPLYLGLVVTGVGVQRIVTAASRSTLGGAESLILTGAVTMVMLAMTAIGAASAGRRSDASSRVMSQVGLAVAMLVIGALFRLSAPVVTVVLVASMCAAQLALSLGRFGNATGRTGIKTSMMKTIAVVLVVLALGAASASAQSRFDVGLLLGSTRATDEGTVLQFDRGTTYQATFAWRIRQGDAASLSVEVPFIASPAFTVITPGASLPLEYASLYLTPGVRVTLAPRAPVSFFGAVGAGYARYSESQLRADRGPNPNQRDTNASALQFGGGVDVRGFGWLGFRGEVRDVYTGARNFSLLTPRPRVHNVITSGGLVVRF